MKILVKNTSSLEFKNGKRTSFDYSIIHHVIIGNYVAIRLDIRRGDSDVDKNILCYNEQGDFVWQLQPDDFTTGFGFVGLSREDNYFWVTNFRGKQMLIEPSTGNVVKEWYTR